MNGSLVHVAGYAVLINDSLLRQRCAWCGAVLIDYNLVRLQVECVCDSIPHDRACPAAIPIAVWHTGTLVRVDGNMQCLAQLAEVDGKMMVPEDACSALDPSVTA